MLRRGVSMQNSNKKYFLFLILTLLLSIPFYVWGAFFSVQGTPFGLPISFLMILVPFFLAIIFAWQKNGVTEIISMFKSILDVKKAGRWALVFSFISMPLMAIMSYSTMSLLKLSLPSVIIMPYQEVPLMIILYFIGAIPEELGWTYILAEPLSKAYGSMRTGFMLGCVWAIWHIIPWSWSHPAWWVAGMIVLDILLRTTMVYIYMHGGRSLFTGILIHTMYNVSAMGLFPNKGSHMNPWIFSVWMAAILLGVLHAVRAAKGKMLKMEAETSITKAFNVTIVEKQKGEKIMMDGTKRDNIKVGMKVAVVQKNDQRSGKLTEGVVARILTNSPKHPHGIKVMLEDNIVGRVKKIMN